MTTMKQLLIIMILCTSVAVLPGCKKKKSGVCYCKYLSGDKKEYDLTGLDRSVARDSCGKLDGYAGAFAGDCDLK